MKRRLAAVALGLAVAAPILFLASASACVGGPILQVSPGEAKPGAEVRLTGISFDKSLPLVVRFNALDGPILGTFAINDDRSLSAATVTIPASTKPGNYVLIGTQPSATGQQAVVPTRALVIVTGPGGRPAVGAPVLGAETGRPAALVAESDKASSASLVLVGLGAFAIALLVAAAIAFFSSQRRTAPPAAATVRTSP